MSDIVRAADRAYALLRREIVAGSLAAGAHLAEADLADRLQLSRTPVREALRRLQSEGLVEVVPHRGARVVDWHSFDVEGIYDLRALIEGFVARRAATRLTAEQIGELERLCDRMEELTDDPRLDEAEIVSGFVQLNQQFHGGIAEACDAEYALPSRNMLVVLPVILQALHNYQRGDITRSHHHHRELLEAFRARDPHWAESVMTSHVLASKARIMEQLRQGDGAAAPAEIVIPAQPARRRAQRATAG